MDTVAAIFDLFVVQESFDLETDRPSSDFFSLLRLNCPVFQRMVQGEIVARSDLGKGSSSKGTSGSLILLGDPELVIE